MRVRDWPLPDRFTALGVALLCVGSYLPWARNPWEMTLGFEAEEYVAVMGLVPARLVVLVLPASYLVARQVGVSERTEAALLATTSLASLATPAVHLVAANASGWPARLGPRYYAVVVVLSLWVLGLSYRLAGPPSTVETAILVVVGLAGLVVVTAYVVEVALSEGHFVPDPGFYAVAITSPLFGGAAALKYVEHATGLDWTEPPDGSP